MTSHNIVEIAVNLLSHYEIENIKAFVAISIMV